MAIANNEQLTIIRFFGLLQYSGLAKVNQNIVTAVRQETLTTAIDTVRLRGPCPSATLWGRVVEGHCKLWWAMPTLLKNYSTLHYYSLEVGSTSTEVEDLVACNNLFCSKICSISSSVKLST